MLHPSYLDLIEVANQDVPEGEDPIVTSRYSIILAAAKRARQLVDGADPMMDEEEGKKPLSIAVDELYAAQIHILPPAPEDFTADDPSTSFQIGDQGMMTESWQAEVEDEANADEEKDPDEEDQTDEDENGQENRSEE